MQRTTKNYKGLQRATKDYKGLQRIAREFVKLCILDERRKEYSMTICTLVTTSKD